MTGDMCSERIPPSTCWPEGKFNSKLQMLPLSLKRAMDVPEQMELLAAFRNY